LMPAQITKADFYRLRGESYEQYDPEALVRYRNALEWILLRDGVVIREVGCKYAVLRDVLAERGLHPDYMAADIDAATLRKIPGFNEQQFICHDVNRGLPFADSSADYLVCLEVLEHLENATAFLDEAKRVLRPGGRLIVSVPNPYCWMEWLGNLRRSGDTEGHVATYTHQNIDALMKFSGLVLRDVTGTFTRIPFSRRLFGKYSLLRTNRMLLTRSYMFLIEKP
jgi:SAM-dependent methyltransferase